MTHFRHMNNIFHEIYYFLVFAINEYGEYVNTQTAIYDLMSKFKMHEHLFSYLKKSTKKSLN